MAKIQDLLEAAKGAIISGACHHATALCEHVLDHYPKHLEAHCLLAEGYREQGDAATAEDLFLRVLSADPERLIARWALSILYGQRNEREAALKQLQIALELSPDHAELRRDLVEMSGEKPKVTIGGLARLYLRGGIFDRAGNEFRRALEREPQRLDLRLGLAELLWRDGQYDRALQRCRRILEDSPDCLKALLIAGLIEATGTKQAEAEHLLEAARALDPEDLVACELARQMDLDPGDIGLIREPVTVPDPASKELMAYFAPEPVVAQAVTAPALDVHPPTRITMEPEALAPARTPQQDTASAPVAQIGTKDAERLDVPTVAAPVPPVTLESAKKSDSSATKVPDWLASEATAENGAGGEASEWGEWASLLNEDIALDSAAEARLSAALVEIPAGEAMSAGKDAVATNRAAHHDSGEIEALRQAVAEQPADDNARLALAKGYAQAGMAEAAVVVYRELLAAAPYLGEQIADGLQAIVRREPNNADAHRALGDLFMKTGRFQQAIDEYNLAVGSKSG